MLPAPTTDRRYSDRFLPTATTFCRTSSGGEGVVWNVSATGLGMLIGFPPEPGQTLALELSNCAESLFLAAKAVHVRQLEGGGFFVGLRFACPLDRHQMEPFVRPHRICHAEEHYRR